MKQRWEGTAAVRALLGYLPRVDPRRTVALVVAILVSGALPVVFMVTSGLLVGTVPAALQQGWGSPAVNRLWALLVLTGAVFLSRQVVEPVRGQITGEIGAAVELGLQQRVMHAVSEPVGVAHLEDPSTLDRVAQARGLDSLVGPAQAVRGLSNLATRYLAAAGATVVVSSWRWWLGPVVAAVYIVNGSRCRREFGAIARLVYGFTGSLRRAGYLRDLALTSEAAKETRVFGLGGWLEGRYVSAWMEAMTEVWRSRRRSLVVFLSMAALVAVVKGLAFLYVGVAGARGEITLATATVVLQALNGVAAFGQITKDDVWVAQGSASVPAALALEEITGAARALSATGSRPAAGHPESFVRFEGVRFAYPGSDAAVLDGLDLEVAAGQSLAIVGANGAGKTTLVKLLARMYDPQEGRIVVDGVDLRDFDAEAWQRRVAAIFQDFVRYELSATDNVGFGCLALASDERALRAAAERAGALPIVESLPHGWRTVLSRQYDDGVELSGGQWQRVALARALLAVAGGARVLVLDEPTANLDVRAEADLHDRFLELTEGLTTVLISHRFSTVRRADRIVVLDGGRVIEEGAHDHLLTANGLYARMYNLQAARFADENSGALDTAEGAS